MDELPLSFASPPAPPSRAPLPPVSQQQKRRVTLAAGLALLWGIFTLWAQFSGALNALEEPLLDWRQALTSSPAPSSNQLALIAIDTIPPDRPWPWSRFEYSLALRSLVDYGPQSVVLEMPLNDRDTEFTSFDETFSHVVDRVNTVIFASTLMAPVHSESLPDQVDALSAHGDTRLVPRYSSALWPLQTFAGHSPVGANNVESEDGFRLRRLPLVFFLGDKMIPSLVLQAAAHDLDASLAASEIVIGRAIYLRRADGKLLRTIPIDDEGRLRIRYRPGPVASWQTSFENLLLDDDMVQHGLKPESDLHALTRHQVWIGRTDAGERARFHTPEGQLSRTEVELQAERTILDQDYVRPLPPMILATLYLLVAIGGATLLIRLGPVHGAATFLLVAVFWFESSVLAFQLYNVILPLPSFALLLLGSFIVGVLASFWDFGPQDDPRQLPLKL